MRLCISSQTEAEVLKLALAKLYIDSKGPTSAIAQKLFARFVQSEESKGKKKAANRKGNTENLHQVRAVSDDG